MKRHLMIGVLTAAIAAAAAMLGCNGPAARRPTGIPSARLRANPRLAEGQYTFMQHCNQCHVGGAAGLGPSLNDKSLPAFFVKLQIRQGFGAMPSFPKHVISDAQLDDVLHYLRYLRDHPDGPVRS